MMLTCQPLCYLTIIVVSVLRSVGAACLGNKDITDALALLKTNVDAESRWTTVEVLAAVQRGMCSISAIRV